MSVPMEEMEEQIDPAMSDDELVSKCMEEVSRGIGGTSTGDGNENVDLALEYYYGRLPGLKGSRAKDPHASRFVSMDVLDGVEATVAEIMPAFTTDMIAFYEPDDERDEEAARTESELMNYLFMEEYSGYSLLQVALKDALLCRNCTVKTYWDERACVEYELHEDIPELALQMVMQPTAEDQEVEVVYQEVTEQGDPSGMQEIESVAMIAPGVAQQVAQTEEGQQEAQQAMIAAQDKYTIKIKRTTIKGRPVVESVAPENVIVAGDHDSPMLHECRFVAHELLETQSSLIEQGFDPAIVEELGTHSTDIDSYARKRVHSSDNYDYETADRSTRLILVYECYPLIDFDGDGIAERRKVVISCDRLLSNEEWGDVTLIGGTGTIVPHKYQGISLFDRLKEIQDSKTPVIRSIVDGTQLSSNPRIGIVTGEVNLDDLLTSRTGGAVRIDNANSVINLPNPEIPQSSYTMLEYFDQLRSERGGSAVGTSAQAMQVSGDTAHGIERAMSAMEMNNAVVARTIGETLIQGIFVQLHSLLREHHMGPVNARINGRWITTVPSDWKKRTSVSVQVGSSHAERARQSMVLGEVVADQKELIAMGSPLADEKGLYAAMADRVALNGIKEPERYLIDPESPEGQQAKSAADKQKAEAKARGEFMEESMFEAQQKLSEAEMLKGKADMEAQRVELHTKQQKQQSDNAIAALKLQLQEQQQELDGLKAGTAQAYDYDKLVADTALKITEMEIQANRDLSQQTAENKPEVQQ